MKAYKVFLIRRDDYSWPPTLISVFARGDAEVKYREGEWSEAPGWLWEKGYGLCCFKTEEQAKNFMEGVPPWAQLWEVEVVEIVKELPPRVELVSLELKNLDDLAVHSWSEGTIMAKKVKPIRYIFYKINRPNLWA